MESLGWQQVLIALGGSTLLTLVVFVVLVVRDRPSDDG